MSQTYEQKYDKASVELKRIVDLFSSQELPCLISKVFIQTGKPSSKWSLGNKLIMLSNGSLDARGFNQWKEVNRYVKAGTHGFSILAPNKIKIQVWNDQKKEQETKFILNPKRPFVAVAVHPVENTDGQELEYFKPKVIPPLMEVAQKMNIPVRYDDTKYEGAYGYYDQVKREIVLGTDDVSTFFHELSHAAHHIIEKETIKPGAEAEAIAELSACVLASLYGYNIESQSWTYISGYTQDKSVSSVGQICMRVLSKVEQILKLILGESEA